jgi:predicted GNAT family N-acyltransferase
LENVTSVISPSSQAVQQWWEMYQEGFLDELKWLEARGEQTSLTLGTTASVMFKLTFRNRHAFVARCRLTHIPWGYLTLDDISETKTSFSVIRQVLVDSKHRGLGIASSLLKHTILLYSKQFHLAIKYAKFHNLDRLYSKFGFTKISSDSSTEDNYVHMVLQISNQANISN